MAAIAARVLHDVGNVVNSANVSTTLLKETLQTSHVKTLMKVSEILAEHEGDLESFLTEDKNGRQLPRLLRELSRGLAEERNEQIEELRALSSSIEHIKEIIALQRNFSQVHGIKEPVDLVELLEDALRINFAGVAKHGIRVMRAFGKVQPIITVRHKALQILVNIISNAKHALRDADCKEKLITMTVTSAKNSIRIQIRDNGIGIPPRNLNRLFLHGFTTRKDGNGVGLHSSALAAHELGGVLSAESEGEGQGAIFTLTLPINRDAPMGTATEA
jgi:signal transduction histidine kinase